MLNSKTVWKMHNLKFGMMSLSKLIPSLDSQLWADYSPFCLIMLSVCVQYEYSNQWNALSAIFALGTSVSSKWTQQTTTKWTRLFSWKLGCLNLAPWLKVQHQCFKSFNNLYWVGIYFQAIITFNMEWIIQGQMSVQRYPHQILGESPT